jgi:hypothetical protein
MSARSKLKERRINASVEANIDATNGFVMVMLIRAVRSTLRQHRDRKIHLSSQISSDTRWFIAA